MTPELALAVWLILGLIGTLVMHLREPVMPESWPIGATFGPLTIFLAVVDRKRPS